MSFSLPYAVAALAFAVVLYAVYRWAAAPAREAEESAPPADPPKERPEPSPAGKREATAKKKKASSAAGPKKPAPAAGTESPPSVPPAPSSVQEFSVVNGSASPALPRLTFEEDDVEVTQLGAARPSVTPARIVYDEDAELEEPTQAQPLILISATAQTDKGMRRKRNEDSVLVRADKGLFVVADGMGGYRGGELASDLAVKTIEEAFTRDRFAGVPHESIPRRASELARAIQMANQAILERANAERHLSGMGTTVCAARFSLQKQRLYIGHVGDSRIYCLRDGALRQMTSDHTMKELGLEGEGSSHLSRAVGIVQDVPIDIILGKPRPGDVYLLCSDGLTKMVADDEIRRVLLELPPQEAVERLIADANAHGGKDNVTAVVVRVEQPRTLGSDSWQAA